MKVIESEPFEQFVKSALSTYFRKKGYRDYVFDPYGHLVDEIYYFAKLLGVEEDVKFIIEPERRKREVKTLFELLDVKHKVYAIYEDENAQKRERGVLGRYRVKKDSDGGDE